MKTVFSLLAMAFIVTLIGCAPSEQSAVDTSTESSSAGDHDHDHGDHDHGDHDHAAHAHGEGDQPESFGEAVEHIQEIGSKITGAFTSGKPDDVHDELHEIGHAIESLPGLAKKAGLSGEAQVSVEEVTEALMDAFGELDSTLHGGDAVDVDVISKKVSEQVQKLQSML